METVDDETSAAAIDFMKRLDGYDQSECLRKVRGTAVKNNSTKSARNLFFYADDDGLLVGARIGDYKGEKLLAAKAAGAGAGAKK
jgi:hypothetical protein